MEFYLRFPAWALGLCFKCEVYRLVAVLGDLTVGGVTIKLYACHPCAWRLEQLHHQEVQRRRTVALVTMTRAENAVAA
ncbi:hypothetical protein ACFRMQ_37245 [Kitasatospora sp. NPDC056783]|uniref:hypothetical protein n=1 Tax=Kitasatospora sp. NPDC056783 TaxID=3345943 RepID=UPI0036A1E6D1